MNKSILLTIAIPTYNGEAYLKATLDSIVEQLENVDISEIEVLVSDNASTDSTPKIVGLFKERYPGLILYYVNKYNLGYDKNVDLLFKNARGRYVEILGDDDFYSSSFCLSKIINVIKKEEDLGILVLPVKFLNISTGAVVGTDLLKMDMLFDDKDEFFSVTKWSTAAVSSLIIKRELWNKLNLEKYYGTQWIHIGALVNILGMNINSYVFSEHLIFVRTENPRWENNFGNQLKSGFVHLSILLEMKNLKFNKKTYNYYIENRLSNSFKDIVLLGPSKYKERLEVIVLMYPLFKGEFIYWVVFIPSLLIPKWVFRKLKMLLSQLKILLNKLK